MQTVRLGRTNAAVSAAGLGCGGHSRLGMSAGASAQEAARVVSAAIAWGSPSSTPPGSMARRRRSAWG